MAISKPSVKASSAIKSFKSKPFSVDSVKTPKSFSKLVNSSKFAKTKKIPSVKKAVLKKAVKNVGY